MLVISRRIGESFLIGDNIEATVIDITGEKVVLGVQAPREMNIERTGPEADSAQDTHINAKGYGRQYKHKLGETQKKDPQ